MKCAIGLKVYAKKCLYFVVAQVVTVVTVLACYRLCFFIGEDLSLAFEASNFFLPDGRYSLLFRGKNDLFNVDVSIAMEARH
jgi:hypothetical protein